MSDDGSTAVEKKGRGRPKANGTQVVHILFTLLNVEYTCILNQIHNLNNYF